MTTIDMHNADLARYFTLATIRARLKLEIAGMLGRRGTTTLQILNLRFGTNFNRRQHALRWIDECMQTMELAFRQQPAAVQEAQS